VSRLGTPVILASRLGFLLTDAPKLERNFTIAEAGRRSTDQRWEQPWGERRFVRDRHNELRVRLTETVAPGRSMDVVFRVFDDGVGFRYEFPAALGQVNIAEEITEFAIASPATAWWIPAFQWNREEYLYNKTALTEIGIAQTPMTIRTDGRLHIAFHEASLVDYSGMNLQNEGKGRFRAILTPSSTGAKVSRAAPFRRPGGRCRFRTGPAGWSRTTLSSTSTSRTSLVMFPGSSPSNMSASGGRCISKRRAGALVPSTAPTPPM
jgi:alpha-glucosidase